MKGINKIIFINTLVFIPLFISSYAILNNAYQKSFASKIGWKRWWKAELITEGNELGYRGRKFIENGNKKDIILLVGDSQVETSHPFNLMPENILEDSLNAQSKSTEKLKVRTVGSWGFSNVQQYLAIKETFEFAKEKDIKIPLVLLFFTTNDYTDNEIYRTYGLKNVEEEYDYKYSDRIGEIIVEFRDLLSNYKAYDISNKFGYNLYNFIKYHSNNYDRLIETVEKYNDNLEEELERELEEEEENKYY